MTAPRPPQGMTQAEMVRLMMNLRAKVYPEMRILTRVDGTVVVTVPPRAEEV